MFLGSELLSTTFAPLPFSSSKKAASLICSSSLKASVLYAVNADVCEIGL